VRSPWLGPLAGLAGAAGLGAALTAWCGVSPFGITVQLIYAVTMTALLIVGLRQTGAARFGPANWVTLTRATLVGGVTALVFDRLGGQPATTPVVVLAGVALVLDGIDGRVARRSGSVTVLGARFDMEVDAFLILVLSLAAAVAVGPSVLVIGFARYGLLIAASIWPWLRRPSPPRYWCKIVAAGQGVVLAVVAAGWFIDPVAIALAAVALAFLAESFGREIGWLFRHRADPGFERSAADKDRVAGPPRSPLRRWSGRILTGLEVLVVWVALVAPNQLEQINPAAFLRIPVEGLAIVGVSLVLPYRPRRVFAVVVGAAVAALVVVKVLDIGFHEALDRPVALLTDWTYAGSAAGVLRDSVGGSAAVAIEIGLVAALVVGMVAVGLSVVRLSRTAARHRSSTARIAGALAVTWLLCLLIGVPAGDSGPVAARSAFDLASEQAHEVNAAVRDEQNFTSALQRKDSYAVLPGNDLLTSLRGKDVVIAFIESYGRTAVAGSSFAPGVDATLAASDQALAGAGFQARSGFLTSPTFGGISWLAHSTLQSGVWVDSQTRYDQLMTSDHFTLSDAFGRAGWRTVVDVPSNTQDWAPARSFYHYDQVYDSRNVGYVGPKFSYAAMPDQYTLATFADRELGPGHAPVMAEIDLVSSHTPWTPLPRLVPWSEVGDGSIFAPMPAEGPTPDQVWRSADHVRDMYGQSVQYTWNSLVSFVQNAHDDNLVLIALGDHQPAKIVSGTHPDHDVPISIIAHDPTVLDGISSWGWEDGLLPSSSAPVWRMDTFRNRFLSAYGSSSTASGPPKNAHR
jgi:phosphatidylglycerophosphate synthase